MSFTRFDQQDLVVSADSITGTVWSGNIPTLSTFLTSSTQVASSNGVYYYAVYQTASTDSTAAVQFDVLYADQEGSGSALFNPLVNGTSPSSVEYGSYRTLVLGDENASFIMGNYTSSNFYIISVDRARYKESIFPSSMNLKLGDGTNTLELTDNSQDVATITYNDSGRVFQVVSGSNGSAYSGSGYTGGSGSYGLFLPDIGTILLNGDALFGSWATGGINILTGRNSDTNDQNPEKLINSMVSSSYFALNSQETISSNFVFVRARNSDYNYSENPSYISGSSGEILYPLFVNSPVTYITTVGLYNDGNELLAVAKLSRPLQKDFTKELLMRVKLDF